MQAGTLYPVSDTDLASRLSFFLWSSIPDDALLSAAAAGQLSNPTVLEQQVRRMLADPRSSALVDNHGVTHSTGWHDDAHPRYPALRQRPATARAHDARRSGHKAATVRWPRTCASSRHSSPARRRSTGPARPAPAVPEAPSAAFLTGRERPPSSMSRTALALPSPGHRDGEGKALCGRSVASRAAGSVRLCVSEPATSYPDQKFRLNCTSTVRGSLGIPYNAPELAYRSNTEVYQSLLPRFLPSSDASHLPPSGL
jgi:hypothetical protein